MKNLVLFASGSGTNVQRIVEYFKDSGAVRTRRIYVNKPDAYVLTRAEKLAVPSLVFNRSDFYHTDLVLNALKQDNPDLIVLAGFLWLIPESILDHFEGRIINIHPALLPKYGGKGMYGMRVHESVILNREKESGISIHQVNKRYDEGKIIFQASCPINPQDTPELLAQKIHQLEYEHFPKVIEQLLID